ncbi:hypothetical protein HanXRQr2_Chr06g0261921 [Helianthus annuus]|uniref:Uncharacterized protein n=1 Tax=Helianthus annuus TaxID=4232 RepID=A0A9K3IT57_HELAN|nr:hypothetical protein HanXRQr2_Chr06g0261921 [Helianthus annuus]KAJ0915679.1 hypothetical protein HanPSC8_Chr06g0252641 [Helianthus annuus]
MFPVTQDFKNNTSLLVTSMSAAGSVDTVIRRSYGYKVSPSSSSTSFSLTSSCIVRVSILLLIMFSFEFDSAFGGDLGLAVYMSR